MAATTRTIEKVMISAEAAGLSSRIGPVQVLKFSSSCMSDEYRLLELPPKILETLQEGDSVVIRGENQEDAILCTKDTTYEMKLADTSNTLMLMPECQTPKDHGFTGQDIDLIERQVCSCHSEYYELRPGRPHLHKLRNLLRECLYKGPEHEQDEELDSNRKINSKYTLYDLLNVVQGSEQEIIKTLAKLGALKINGFWRLLDTDYEERVVVRILTLLEEKAWSYEEVPGEECCEVLQELEPRLILEHCLERYGEERTNDSEDGQSRIFYRLLEDKICQFYAEYLLRPAGRFNYYEFMESWQQSVPDGMNTKSEHLAGLALTDMKSHPPVIWHFPSCDLPEDPAMRFTKLFRTRHKWTYDEIQPYIRDLVGSGQSLNALLLKFARSSKDDTGNKVYSSKKPV